jgi:predicted AlkP superfamily phosphohydrolase/phosphomutase
VAPDRSAAGIPRPLASLAPIDWRRSRAVALHGNLAALVYLNTVARFGAGPLVSSNDYDCALAETIAAFEEARHPETGEALFTDVYATREGLGCDPLERSWPDVAAIPADGFHTRPKFDPVWRLMMPDVKLAGTHRRAGVLMIDAPGVRPGKQLRADLSDVAPTVLQLLGSAVPGSMSGRALRELWGASPAAAAQPIIALLGEASRAEGGLSEFATVGLRGADLTAEAQAEVESRLRDLGYLE